MKANATPAASDSLLNLAAWSTPSRVNRKGGSMIVRKAPMNDDFRKQYKRSKSTFTNLGITVQFNASANLETIVWEQDPQAHKEDLQRWRKEVRAFEKKLDFDFDTTGLLKYQPLSVARNLYALSKYGFSLEASDTGYGKTYVACAIARHLGLKMFVCAPKKALKTWRTVVAFFNALPSVKKGKSKTIEFIGVVNIEKLKAGNTEYGGYQPTLDADGNKRTDGDGDLITHWEWSLPEDTLMVVDEVHRFKGRGSQNATCLLAAAELNIPILAMSASAANDPSAMRALGKLLNLHDGSDKGFVDWAKTNGCVHSGFGDALQFFGGNDTLQELHRDIFPEHGNRQRVADLPDFPETQITAEAYDLGGNARHVKAAYDELAKELMLIEEKSSRAKCKLTVLLRARQKVELQKIPLFVEMAKDALDEGMSVVVFVNFTDTLQAVAKQLKTDCVIHGAVSQRQRDINIEDFQANRQRVLVCNTMTGGESISLHDLQGGHPRYVLISPDWSSYNFTQVKGRVHRAGGKTPSIQRYVYAAGCVEEDVARNVNEKLKNMATINDCDVDCGVRLLS